MNWKRCLLIGSLVLSLLAAGATAAVWAQDYRFALDRSVSHVIVNQDGSADIEYWLTFTCDPGAHEIDIVDVGLPNKSYRLDSAVAKYISPDGVESSLSEVLKSEWLDVGVEVHLREHSIQPGEQGTVYLRINVGEMVYPDTSDETYASVRFTPHYYEPPNVHGTTDLEVDFYFPPGVTSEETRWHEREFDETDMVDDRLVFVYLYPDASPSKSYPHGISFPRSAVDVVNRVPVMVGRIRSGGSGSAARRIEPASQLLGLGMILVLVAGIVGGIAI